MPMTRGLPTVALLAVVWSAPAAAQPPAPEPVPPPPAAQPAAPAPTVPPAATAPSPEPAVQAAPPAAAPPVAAPPPPPRRSADNWWETYEPRPRSSAKLPLVITGSSLAGLGVLTLFAAGITWLTAAGHAAQLDCDADDLTSQYEWERCCPNGKCVKGTSGGDSYESAKDLSVASEVLVAVAFPMMGVGVSLAILGAGIRGGGDRKIGFKVTPSGVVLEGQF
ncbi:MAG: hypothetical protein JRI68_01270 [Deltaproteobacteria bacterium]|nr:hypothetical protein [Deltaproteobacteria bacterium]